jgi:hypothetical protein
MFKKFIVMLIVTAFLITACSPKAKPADSTSPNETGQTVQNNDTGKASPDELSQALNIVLGSDETPSVFPSYHIDVTLDSPKANNDFTAIVNEVTTISADVQGKNIHLFQTNPGAAEASEGFIIGDSDKEYKMVSGAAEETLGQVALGWAFWPLDVVVPYALASALWSNKTGTDTIDGRSAVIYAIDSSKGDPAAIAALTGNGLFGTITASGNVWIDKETGGMLKLEMTYTTGVSNLNRDAKIGDGTGTISLLVSKVGQVTVTSPVK